MQTNNFSESIIEQAALAWLKAIGWETVFGPDIAPGMLAAERENYSQVVLERRLRQALQRLNPQISADALEEAFRKLTRPEFPSVVSNNHAFHKMLVEGIPVEIRRKDLPAPRPDCFFVYAIRCDNNSIYIGQTEDLERRWREHMAGTAADYTRKYRPVELEHYEEYDSREKAVEREKWLKTGYGRTWLKREIAAGRARQAGGSFGHEPIRAIDFDNPDNNDFLAVNQFTVVENLSACNAQAGQIERRPDVVLFVNGLPVAVIELKTRR